MQCYPIVISSLLLRYPRYLPYFSAIQNYIPVSYISGACCVVVTSKDLKKNGDIWVCPNTDHVCTRFFFVYDDMASAVQFDTRHSQCKREINHAVEHIRNFKKGTK